MTNWDASLQSARQAGKVHTFYPVDVKLPMVAPQTAWQRLLSRYQRESTTLVPFMQQRRAYERLMRRRNPAKPVPETLVDDASLLQYQQMKSEIIVVRRRELTRLRSQHLFNDVLIRQKEFELDLEQLPIRKSPPDRH